MRNFLQVGIVLSLVLSYVNVSAQTEIQCQNSGTLATASDDFIIFNLNPAAPVANYVAPYTYTVTATQGGNPVGVLLSNGSAATSVPFGIVSPFRTGSGTAGAGNIILTVTPNFGASPVSVQYNLADPGACATPATCESGQKTVKYRYRSPMSTTDASNWQTAIPKFNSTPNQTLTNVAVSMTANVVNSFILENNANSPKTGSTDYMVEVKSDIFFKVDGTNVPLANNLGTLFTQSFALPNPISVPASGAWGGDINGSTLYRMEVDGWLSSRAFTYLNPLTDARWVTSATGSPATDDDIFIKPSAVYSATNSIGYSAPTDLLKFIGTSGNIPLTYSTVSAQSVFGGGNNFFMDNYTQTYYEVEVTYTYNQTCDKTLPVKLESFDGEKVENGIRLKWKVTSEENFDHYDIEHSSTAKNFAKIGTVPGQGLTLYSFVHDNPFAGEHYYRLKAVDKDGTFSNSRIVEVTVDGNSSANIYPNPIRTSELLTIPSTAGSLVGMVEIFDISGRRTQTFDKVQAERGISISSLRAGLYLVRVQYTGGLVRTSKLVVSE